MENQKYIIYKLIDICFADPISSMILVKDYVLIGTMLGRITLFTLSTQKLIILSELNTENVSNISYIEEENIFNVSIGDAEILRYKINKSCPDIEPFCQQIKNYTSDLEHNKYCENAFVIMNSNYLLRVQLCQPEESNVTLVEVGAEFEIKNFTTDFNNSGLLPMTNYSIPLDFDGEKFAWVEFFGSDTRNICVADILNFSSDDKPYKTSVDKKYGHISHMKLLHDSKLLIVHSLNLCDIRKLNESFTLIESFKHIGDKVYAIDVIYQDDINNEKNKYGLKNNNMEDNEDIISISQNNDFLNINKISNVNPKMQNNSISFGNSKEYKKKFSEARKKTGIPLVLSVVTLDIDGNVNLYNYYEETKLFNIYELPDFAKEYKNKQLFSMGYEYYIKTDLNYFCISTDYGCFIIKKNF